jgi:hypothetical protein
MSIATAIYKAPIVGKAVLPDAGEVSVIIQYNHRLYEGVALLHPEDQDFFSEKVGTNIALSRARIEALEDALIDLKTEAQVKAQMYLEVTRFGQEGDYTFFDPTDMFYQNQRKAQERAESLSRIIKKEKLILSKYLEGQARALESVKRFRARQNETLEKDEEN